MSIKDYMKLLGVSYRTLAKLWGVHYVTIFHWASGKHLPGKRHRTLIKNKTKGVVTFEEE